MFPPWARNASALPAPRPDFWQQTTMKPAEPLNIEINSRHLDWLESEAIYILREVAAGLAHFPVAFLRPDLDVAPAVELNSA